MSAVFVNSRGSSIASSGDTATASLFLTISVLPIAETGYYIGEYPKLTVTNGVTSTEVKLIAARVSEGDAIGKTGSFTILVPTDRDLINSDSLFKLERVANDGTVLQTIINNASLVNDTFSVVGENFTFNVISDAAGKLTKCPDNTLIIRDSDRVPFDVEDVEEVKDVAGNSYLPEDLAIADLTRNDGLEEILVNRCGFSSYFTDIENDKIKRFDFDFGVPYIEGLKASLGAFNPIITTDDEANTISIFDRTMLKAEGFPTPPVLNYKRIVDYNMATPVPEANYVELIYSEGGEYDGFYPTYKPYTRDNGGDESDGTLLTEVYLDVYANYYKNELPDIIQAQLLVGQSKSTYRGVAVSSNLVREDFYETSFDRYARITRSTNRVNELVPDPDNPGEFIWKENTEVNSNIADFGQHPTKNKSQYPKAIKSIKTGLGIRDTANPYKWNSTEGEATWFFRDAHRGMNIDEGMEYVEDLKIKSSTERFRPNRSGLVQFERSGFDFLRNTTIDSKNDQRAGDVSLNGSTGQTNRILVGENDDSEITGRKITLSAGEMSLDKAINWARRILRRLKYKNRTLNLAYIGFDANIKLGAEFSIPDKDLLVVGSFLVTNYELSWEVDQNTGQPDYKTTLQAIEI